MLCCYHIGTSPECDQSLSDHLTVGDGGGVGSLDHPRDGVAVQNSRRDDEDNGNHQLDDLSVQLVGQADPDRTRHGEDDP